MIKNLSLQGLFLWSRKIHRFCLWITIILTLVMGGTGILLKYYDLATFFNINLYQVRVLHREVSGWFVVVLSVMMLTGLVMYLVPEILKRRNHPES